MPHEEGSLEGTMRFRGKWRLEKEDKQAERLKSRDRRPDGLIAMMVDRHNGQ